MLPEPLQLARRLAPLLAGLDWAIGGSVLLHRLGLEAAPGDLDLVISEADFMVARDRLAGVLGSWARPYSDKYVSRYFASFTSAQGHKVDLIAGIAVRQGERIVSWSFDPGRNVYDEGLPWMQPEDWLVIYTLFERAERVRQLEAYLAAPPLSF